LEFEYFNPNKTIIDVDYCDTFWKQISGLMFKSNSKPLLFTFDKQAKIHSLFCKPFKAIWLDKNRHLIKEEVITNWKLSISCDARYLIEVLI